MEVVGFSCVHLQDRSLKNCKGHGGFYVCERCETRDRTRNRKRVYPSIRTRRRTKISFRRQRQIKHRLEGKITKVFYFGTYLFS